MKKIFIVLCSLLLFSLSVVPQFVFCSSASLVDTPLSYNVKGTELFPLKPVNNDITYNYYDFSKIDNWRGNSSTTNKWGFDNALVAFSKTSYRAKYYILLCNLGSYVSSNDFYNEYKFDLLGFDELPSFTVSKNGFACSPKFSLSHYYYNGSSSTLDYIENPKYYFTKELSRFSRYDNASYMYDCSYSYSSTDCYIATNFDPCLPNIVYTGSSVNPDALSYLDGLQTGGHLVYDWGEPGLAGFIQYLVDNKKYLDLTAFGFKNNADTLRSIIDVWSDCIERPLSFKHNVASSCVDTADLTIDNINGFYDWVNQQYVDYKRSLMSVSVVIDEPPLDDLKTDTTVTDSDSTDIHILRRILMSILNLPSNIFNKFSSSVDAIIYNISRLISNISSIGYRISRGFNDVIDVIKNIDIPVPGSVDNSERDNSNYTKFSDLKSAFNSKFAFFSQCSDLITNIYSTLRNSTVSNTLTFGQFSFNYSFLDDYQLLFQNLVVGFCYVGYCTRLLRRLPHVIGGV